LKLWSRYEQLCRFYPDVTEYKIYLAQSAFKSANYELAVRSANSVQDPQYRQRLLNLIAACEYEQGDLASCKGHLDQCIQDEADTVVAQGCVYMKEGEYDRALEMFESAMKIMGYQAELAYNIALCYYKTKQFGPAMKNIAEIIEKGVREHPELGIGSNTEGMDVRSVGNTAALRQTALIEAFNLKAALEYGLKNYDAAREALSDMPPRSESELDPVTLHNQGLLSMDTEPNSGFKKLNFLLSQPPFPNETFSNLVILYCKYGFYDQAADVLAQNIELSYKNLRSSALHEAFADNVQRTSSSMSTKYCTRTSRKRLQPRNIRFSRRHHPAADQPRGGL
jgi:tetratricopeptide repeat protein 30